MNKLLNCPKCGFEIKIIRDTDWDNLDTYLYPICDKCKWTTKEIFYNVSQIEAYIKSI